MEHAPNDKRAFYGSFVPVSTFSAFACAAVIAYSLKPACPAKPWLPGAGAFRS